MDVYVHHTAVMGRAILRDDDKVTFDVVPGKDNKPAAVNVRLSERAASGDVPRFGDSLR